MIIPYKYPDLTAVTVARSDRDTPIPVLRWLILGAVSLMLIVLALSRAGAVGAAAPANCIAINYTTCMSNGVYYTNGTPTSSVATAYTAPYAYGSPYAYAAPFSYGAPNAYIAPNTTSGGYATNSVVSTYYDPRYGVVSVVTDASGNLIDINAATGQRIYPVFPDYGYSSGYYNGNYVSGNYATGCAAGNFSCQGYTPYANSGYSYGYMNGNYATGCQSGNFSCQGANAYYGAYPYTPGLYAGNANVVAAYRVAEVAQPAVTTTVMAAAPAAVTPAQVAVPAPVASVASGATALDAPAAAPLPTSDGSGVKTLSVQTTTAPAAANDGREDGK